MVKKIMMLLFLVGVAMPASSLVAADATSPAPRDFWDFFYKQGERLLAPFLERPESWAEVPRGYCTSIAQYNGKAPFDTTDWFRAANKLDRTLSEISEPLDKANIQACIALFKRAELYSLFWNVLKKIFDPKTLEGEDAFSCWLADAIFGKEPKVRSCKDVSFTSDIASVLKDGSFVRPRIYSTGLIINRLRRMHECLISGREVECYNWETVLKHMTKALGESWPHLFIAHLWQATSTLSESAPRADFAASSVPGVSHRPSISLRGGASSGADLPVSMPLAVAGSSAVFDSHSSVPAASSRALSDRSDSDMQAKEKAQLLLNGLVSLLPLAEGSKVRECQQELGKSDLDAIWGKISHRLHNIDDKDFDGRARLQLRVCRNFFFQECRIRRSIKALFLDHMRIVFEKAFQSAGGIRRVGGTEQTLASIMGDAVTSYRLKTLTGESYGRLFFDADPKWFCAQIPVLFRLVCDDSLYVEGALAPYDRLIFDLFDKYFTVLDRAKLQANDLRSVVEFYKQHFLRSGSITGK